MAKQLRKTPLVVKNSEDEAKVIEELAKRKGTSESNLIRRLLKAEAETQGIDVTGLFEDGRPGNWLPKPKGKDLPVTNKTGTGRNNTTASADTLAAAL